ncbi:enoyl-CoA hydratase-related protein [Sporichthya polymorpha]|uniref:enoyl-CoA hydratase-related protein n=1 Tax=Sporichthya polymorpha TaxID=35751 RepID=UPI00036A0B45|nr:enoyl-CoA hydratase-related protein [Sporichthya polymorpha]
MQEPLLITPPELADGAAGSPLFARDGFPIDPILFVDLDASDDPRALGVARDSQRILVGVASHRVTGPLVAALDLTVVPRNFVASEPGGTGIRTMLPFVGVDDPLATAGVLAEAVAANRQAAIVLAGLLRADFPAERAALVAESLAYSTLLAGPEFRRWLDVTPRPDRPVEVADPVLVRREETPIAEILHVTLNRPERRNAYGRQLRDALVDALTVARNFAREEGFARAKDSRLRVYLDGAGPSFCAGGDLAEFGTAPDPVTAHLVRLYAGAALPMLELSDHIEARVHGPCVGAGVELPAFAGRLIAAPGTTFRLPELSMGLIPGAGGTVSLPRRIGRWRTLYLLLSGVELDLDTALAWRLVDGIGPVVA